MPLLCLKESEQARARARRGAVEHQDQKHRKEFHSAVLLLCVGGSLDGVQAGSGPCHRNKDREQTGGSAHRTERQLFFHCYRRLVYVLYVHQFVVK